MTICNSSTKISNLKMKAFSGSSKVIFLNKKFNFLVWFGSPHIYPYGASKLIFWLGCQLLFTSPCSSQENTYDGPQESLSMEVWFTFIPQFPKQFTSTAASRGNDGGQPEGLDNMLQVTSLDPLIWLDPCHLLIFCLHVWKRTWAPPYVILLLIQMIFRGIRIIVLDKWQCV